MSDAWYTGVYFPRQAECSYDFLSGIVEALAQADLHFFRASQTGQGQWFGPDGMLYEEMSDVETALRLTAQHRGGSITVYNPHEGMSDSLFLYPCGGGLGHGAAESEYGWVGLSFNYAYLWREPPDVVRRRYELLFRWSNVLARTTHAIYGWGDMGYAFAETGIAVLAADLQRLAIPRLSWWNYFSKEYVERVGRDRLVTAAAWLVHEDDQALIEILHPPGESQHASIEDREVLGL